jgi:hypothetical protein
MRRGAYSTPYLSLFYLKGYILHNFRDGIAIIFICLKYFDLRLMSLFHPVLLISDNPLYFLFRISNHCESRAKEDWFHQIFVTISKVLPNIRENSCQ